MRPVIASILVIYCLCIGQVTKVYCQKSDGRKRAAAAQAYDLGTTGYMNGEYETAAQWFETAYRMAPTAVALMQAVRSHYKAGNEPRAGTLALLLIDNYPEQGEITEYAEFVLKEVSPKYVRLDVICDKCTVDLNGALQDYHSFFMPPSRDNEITANFGTGQVVETIYGEPGEEKSITFEPPAAVGEDEKEQRTEPMPPVQEETSKPPLSPLFATAGTGVTLALAGVTTWSAINMYKGVDKYEEAAKSGAKNAHKLLKAGESKELRTNILLASTLVMAAGTALVAIVFTDWSEWFGQEEESKNLSLYMTPLLDGSYTAIQGRF